LKISTDGNEDNAKWVPGWQCSIHQVNRRVLIITMPEWFAVKIGLIAMGALPFGEKDDKFTDRKFTGFG
jgi:hypothetical protein